MHSTGAHSTKRILGYDVLRVVSIVAVVATHVLMVYRGTPDQNDITAALDDLLHFAVPAFFFVSGALVWGGYRGRGLRDYVSFLHKRASVVLGPYLVWSALYLLIDVFRGDRLYWLSNSPLLLLTGQFWYHLYFVPVLILFYLLTPLVAPVVRHRPELLVLVAFLARILLRIPVADLSARLGGPLMVTFAVVAMTHLSNMALGAWFFVRKDHVLPVLRIGWPALLASGSALLLAGGASLVPSSLPDVAVRAVVPLAMTLIVLGMVGLAFRVRLNTAHTDRIRRFSGLAFGVYLVHPVFVLALNEAVVTAGAEALWRSAWFPATVTVAITAASFAACGVLAGTPATAWIVGCRCMRRVVALPASVSDSQRRAA